MLGKWTVGPQAQRRSKGGEGPVANHRQAPGSRHLHTNNSWTDCVPSVTTH